MRESWGHFPFCRFVFCAVLCVPGGGGPSAAQLSPARCDALSTARGSPPVPGGAGGLGLHICLLPWGGGGHIWPKCRSSISAPNHFQQMHHGSGLPSPPVPFNRQRSVQESPPPPTLLEGNAGGPLARRAGAFIRSIARESGPGV